MAERDLVGYGGRPPDPRWPYGARLAVQFVLNIEEGAESTILNGDAGSETYLHELPGRPARAGALARFLDYVQAHDLVWVCRRDAIARHWLAEHPAAV